MKKNRTEARRLEVAAAAATPTMQIPLPLGIALDAVEEGFFSLCVAAGHRVMAEMMELDRTALCGPRWTPNPKREAHRAGSAPSEVTLGGRRVPLRRPRVRTVAGQEVELPSFAFAAERDPLDRRTLEAIAVGVSTRDYARSLETLPEGETERSVSKSAVSRRFVALSQRQLTEWLSRPLGELGVRIVLIDGIVLGDHTVLLALGINANGEKHVLALREGTTENSRVARALLADLVERGLDGDAVLFGIDGSKALRKAIRDAFGSRAVVQRCQVHNADQRFACIRRLQLARLAQTATHYDALMAPADDSRELTPSPRSRALARAGFGNLPRLITEAGPKATRRFVEFFTANIRNRNTREAYARAVWQFMEWCTGRGLALEDVDPFAVAAYVETHPGSKPTVKQHLAAIRMLFDFLVVGQVVPVNPASSVRGPKYIVKSGKTPVFSAEETRLLLDSIDTSKISGLRDRALIAAMVYSFARVSAVLGMRVEDYFPKGKRWWFRLHEKGGKHHEVPVHHSAEEYMDAYLQAAGIASEKKTPLFRTLDRRGQLTDIAMSRVDALKMVKRRARQAGIRTAVSNHTWRATGITVYLKNGGSIENAQAIAAHESPRTTKLYDRRAEELSLDEVERIAI